MHIVIFGLTISSSWGNGHATLWRGLCRALRADGHDITFYERDVPYYRNHRDLVDDDLCRLVLYEHWADVAPAARTLLQSADAAIVTSYCPDARPATTLVLDAPLRRVFYDLDSPITLARLAAGEEVPYVPANGFAGFDLVLSYAGGPTLDALRDRLGARTVAPLYGSVDPAVHHPVPSDEFRRNDFSYLGTYAVDRQEALERLFIAPARRRGDLRFALAGSQYPADFPWEPNIFYLAHMPPPDHPSFFCSSRMTLNITRGPMADAGFCPSGRLFEAAACGTPLVSDWWSGLDAFFAPGAEILIAHQTDDVLAALQLTDAELARIARAARERTLAEHASTVRARELVTMLEPSWSESMEVA